MSEVSVGFQYRIRRLRTNDRSARDLLISFGLIPGTMIKIKNRLFGGRYWVVSVHNQLIGLREIELRQLQLYVVTEY